MKRICLACLLPAALHASAGVQPQHLRCEYHVNPVGIDVVEHA